jgi:hypothetical protein
VAEIEENISSRNETLTAVAKYVLIKETEMDGRSYWQHDKLQLDTTFEDTTTYRNRRRDDAFVDKMGEDRRPKETQD